MKWKPQIIKGYIIQQVDITILCMTRHGRKKHEREREERFQLYPSISFLNSWSIFTRAWSQSSTPSPLDMKWRCWINSPNMLVLRVSPSPQLGHTLSKEGAPCPLSLTSHSSLLWYVLTTSSISPLSLYTKSLFSTGADVAGGIVPFRSKATTCLKHGPPSGTMQYACICPAYPRCTSCFLAAAWAEGHS